MFPLTERLKEIEKKYGEIGERLADPAVTRDHTSYQKYAKAHAELLPIVEKYRKLQKLEKERDSLRALLQESEDPELIELAATELKELEKQQKKVEEEVLVLLLPKDPAHEKGVILEIRAGTGGEEAALFTADLCRMYTRYADAQGWRVEVLSSHTTGIGGIKEVILGIEGKGAYGKLRFESGVHRVQRVPITEASGRIHTSTVTVAVLPEAEEVDVQIDPKDLRIDVFRSTGPGGQGVNTTDSAVRITHLPTGMVVTCQDERSQHKNKAKAMKVLRARLLEKTIEERENEIALVRRQQVGTGERSERIRTYNFPQGRVTDHRLGLTLYNLESILEGEVEEIIQALMARANAERLKALA